MPAVDRIVIRGKHEYAQQYLIWYFHEDIGDDECCPTIGLARTFTDFVE